MARRLKLGLEIEDDVEEETKADGTGDQANDIAQGENELDFWLKGHMTGEKRARDVEEEDKFDESAAVKSLEKRMNTLENQMVRKKSTVNFFHISGLTVVCFILFFSVWKYFDIEKQLTQICFFFFYFNVVKTICFFRTLVIFTNLGIYRVIC